MNPLKLLAVLLALCSSIALAQTPPAPFTREELRVYVDRMASGDLDAYHAIGAAMLRGDRLAQDVDGGLDKLNYAADRGHVAALLLLTNWFAHVGDVDRARTALQRALATGSPEAHYGFVQMLDGAQLTWLFPDAADRSRRRLASLERAANGNIPDAMVKLAWHYIAAETKDPVREFYWFEQASMHGHHDAIINLARLLAEAPEKQDGTIAKVAARNPAAAGLLRFELGATYETQRDDDSVRLAARHYGLVADDPDAGDALRGLAQLRYARIAVAVGNEQERAGALSFIEAAATAGSPHAQCFLATELSEEHGLLPRDVAASGRWEKKLRAAHPDEDTITRVCTQMYGP